mmetsp:Transcript_2703/g.3872  ORF Transcript_2703/g.3872 Transcript_2703/m.3872 type:complete len:114 (+) Transcript_2703:1283-1624(+)
MRHSSLQVCGSEQLVSEAIEHSRSALGQDIATAMCVVPEYLVCVCGTRPGIRVFQRKHDLPAHTHLPCFTTLNHLWPRCDLANQSLDQLLLLLCSSTITSLQRAVDATPPMPI